MRLRRLRRYLMGVFNFIKNVFIGKPTRRSSSTSTPDQYAGNVPDDEAYDSSHHNHENQNYPESARSSVLEIQSEDELMDPPTNPRLRNRTESNRPIDKRDEEIRYYYKYCKHYHGRYKEYRQRYEELERSSQEAAKKHELEIGNLTKTADQRIQEINNLTQTADKRMKEISNLTQTLDKNILENSQLARTVDKKTNEINDLKKTAKQQTQRMVKLKDAVTQMTEVINIQRVEITKLTETNTAQKENIAELTKTSEAQRRNITNLTETISRSTQSINTATRDDEYFDAEFASLAGDIRQWVFRYFRGGPGKKYNELPKTLQESIAATVLGYDETSENKITTKDIEAAVTERIAQLIFRSPFFYMIFELREPTVFKFLGGTDRERREWHAKTVDMLAKNNHFSDCLREGVVWVATDLQNCLESLAKIGTEEPRQKTLGEIVEKAAQLGLEIYRQISDFQLAEIKPGSEYTPWLMEDRSGAVDEDEEEGSVTQRSIVQTVLFPPVIRWGFDETGKFSKLPVVLRKATVIARRVEEEQQKQIVELDSL